jgi:ion channel-forming bestrophin family protein
MILRPRLHWLRMLFVWRGSVLRRILPQLLFTTALAALAAFTRGRLVGHKLNLTATPFTLMGVALAVFLGFRNSASYDRYWEARKLWGALIIDGRSYVRQVVTLTRGTPDEKRRLVRLGVAFVHALRHQLRGTDPSSDLARLLNVEDHARIQAAQYPPAMALLMMGEGLTVARESGALEPVLVPAFEQTLSGFSQILGGCERIAGTPIPFTYSVILHRTVYCYCMLLPFGLVDAIGLMTPLMVAFISYTFFALEALSDEIEEPFGTMPNDLALEAMAFNIEATMRESAGDGPWPELPKMDADFVLR